MADVKGPSRADTTVHLLHPPPYGEVPFKHIGLCYVAAGLRAHGYQTRYHDASERFHRRGDDVYDDLILRYSKRAGEMSDLPFLPLLAEVLYPEHRDSELAQHLRDQVDEVRGELGEVRVAALTFNTLTTYFAAAMGRRLRADGAKVLLGGPLARIPALTHLMLRLGAADAVIEGEGDHTMGPAVDALLAGHAPIDVPGANWLDGDRVGSNPVAPPCVLDELPRPEFEGNLLDQFIPIQASRGCVRRCKYCSESGIWADIGYRRRDPAAVVREMRDRAAETGLTDFHFHDDHLNGSNRWLRAFVEEVRGTGFTWESFFEPYGLDAPLIEQMADAGCRLVKYGVQSFSPTVLKSMGRAGSIEQLADVIVDTYHIGISTHYDMLVGFPTETDEDHRTNLRWVDDLYERTGDRLYFSPNPFYLAAGSEVQREPERFGVTIEYADPTEFPPEMGAALKAAPPYPVTYRSPVSRDTLMRRMDELAEILQKHGKDYLYLGQDGLPDTGRDDRRMLPPLPEDGPRRDPAAEAWAAGDEDSRVPALALTDAGNLKLWPLPGRAQTLAGPFTGDAAERPVVERALASLCAGAPLRILGGEPTLSPHLPTALTVARRLGHDCRIETNGLRFSQARYTDALVRRGLRHATVVLLAPEAVLADRLGGRPGAFDLALAGADRLLAAGVEVEIALLTTVRTAGAVPMMAPFVHERFPKAGAIRILLCPLGGPDAPELPSRQRLNPSIAALIADAERFGQTVVVEDRS